MQPSSHLSKRKSACFWSATTLSGVMVGVRVGVRVRVGVGVRVGVRVWVRVGVRVGVWRPKVVRESKDSLTNNYLLVDRLALSFTKPALLYNQLSCQ